MKILFLLLSFIMCSQCSHLLCTSVATREKCLNGCFCEWVMDEARCVTTCPAGAMCESSVPTLCVLLLSSYVLFYCCVILLCVCFFAACCWKASMCLCDVTNQRIFVRYTSYV